LLNKDCEIGKMNTAKTHNKRGYFRFLITVIENNITITMDIGRKTGFTKIIYPERRNNIKAVIPLKFICTLIKK
jgi:hypothetical protein